MFGFIVGIACLFGLGRVLRRGYGRCGYGGYGGYGYDGCGPEECSSGHGHWGGHGWGGHGWGGHGWGRRRGGFGRRWGGPGAFVSALFEAIEASPGQRRTIQGAVEEVIEAGSKLKEQLASSRKDVAEAFRGESFDENIMADLLTRHDDGIDELRKAMVGALAKIHAELDPEQRERIARWLSRGPGFGPGFGPYRTAHV